MNPFVLEGLFFGLGLAVSLGPIFIALTQTSIEEGVMPGLTVGLGIWVSDLILVALFYIFISEIKGSIESEGFKFWMGVSGAIILLGFGIYLIARKPILDYSEKKHNYKNYLGFWLKGFLINTINPFTFFFWMGVISSYVIGRHIGEVDAIILLSTILTVIVLSDAGKVFLANFLKKWLTPEHINNVSNFSGAILIIFGLFMAFKVI